MISSELPWIFCGYELNAHDIKFELELFPELPKVMANFASIDPGIRQSDPKCLAGHEFGTR